jgi:WD40 repeat protein
MKSRLIAVRLLLALIGLAIVLILGMRVASTRPPAPTLNPTAPPTSTLEPFFVHPGIKNILTGSVSPSRESISALNLEALTGLGQFGRGWPAAADYSPDGLRLAVGTSRGIELFSTADWESTAVFAWPVPVLAIRFSPDGKMLAAGMQDGTVLVLDAVSGKTLHRLIWHERPVRGLAFSGWKKTGSQSWMLASGAEDGSVAVWDLKSGLARYRFTNPLLGYWGYGIRSLAFSPDDAVLVTGGDQGYLSRWNLATGGEMPRLQTQHGLLFSIAFSPDGTRLASACGDGTVQLWDYRSGEAQSLLPGHAYGAWSAAWTGDGKRIATSAGDGTVKIWDAETSTLIREKAVTFTKIDSLEYSPDDAELAGISVAERALILDAQTLEEKHTFDDMPGSIRSAAFSPDGDRSALSAENGVVYYWDFSSGVAIPVGNPRPASSAHLAAEFDPAGGILAAADGVPGNVRLYDLKTLSRRADYRVPGVWALAFAPDGKTLAAGGAGVLMLVDVSSGVTQSIPVASRITSLAFFRPTAEGKPLLAGGMQDGSILIWDPEVPGKGEELAAPGNPAVWCLSASGSLLAVGDDRGDIAIWDMNKRTLLRTFSGYMSTVFGLAISPDGSLIAAGGIQGTIRFWSLQNGNLIRVFPAHNGWVNALVFSPDGRWLLSGGSDGVALIWGVPE